MKRLLEYQSRLLILGFASLITLFYYLLPRIQKDYVLGFIFVCGLVCLIRTVLPKAGAALVILLQICILSGLGTVTWWFVMIALGGEGFFLLRVVLALAVMLSFVVFAVSAVFEARWLVGTFKRENGDSKWDLD